MRAGQYTLGRNQILIGLYEGCTRSCQSILILIELSEGGMRVAQYTRPILMLIVLYEGCPISQECTSAGCYHNNVTRASQYYHETHSDTKWALSGMLMPITQ